MRLFILTMSSLLLSATTFSGAAVADGHLIKSAISAGPAEITADAAIENWDGTVLREGTNGWICLPDRPDTAGNDPWCIDDVWKGFLGAYMKGETPDYSSVGIAYMLAGDTPIDNLDPFAGGCKEGSDDQCVPDPGAHLMLLIPGAAGLASYSDDFKAGGPWVMWPDTPYQHLMVPLGGGH